MAQYIASKAGLDPQNLTYDQLQTPAVRKLADQITDLNYDQVVKFTSDQADRDPHGILIQDMAWDDYRTIPTDIADGYSIVADEFLHQLDQVPTHIFLQAGVGQFSAGMINALIDALPQDQLPTITIVEPAAVACYYLSAE